MNALRRFASLLFVLALLLGGYAPTTRASAPTRTQSLSQPTIQNQPPLAPLADLESGIDCGCDKIGDFLNPVKGNTPSAGTTSPKGTYTLKVTGSSIVNFTITRVADNTIVLSFSGPSGDFGFSPDDNRFAYWFVDAGTTYLRLYNLEASGGAQLSWNASGAFIAVEVLFSPTGKYFFLAELISSNYTKLIILDAKSAIQRYTNQFNFSIIPGEPGDSYGLVGYGFSPDSKDRTFVYSFATNANTISWNVISLKTGNSLLGQTINVISGFWQFSRCGDRLGKIDQTSTSYLQTSLFKTLDGSLVAGSSQTVGIAASVLLKTTTANHLAVIGGTTYTLGSNTASATCPVIPTLDTFNLGSASIMGGSSVTGTVELNVPAPTGGTVISLASSKPLVAAVPSSVTIPAGSRAASFNVTTFEVSSPTDVIISATLGSVTIPETLHVLISQPVLTAITPNKTTIKPGEALTITVSLSKAAPTGGIHVSISNDHSTLIQMPAEVIIPAGKSSAWIKVFPVEVTDVTIVILSASFNNVTKTAQVNLWPHPPKLAAFQIKPSVVKGGNFATGVITLTKAVPAGMVVDINLSTTHPEAVSMFNTLSISGGYLSGTFWITTHGMTETITAMVTASLDEITRTSSLQVQPADLSEFSFEPACGIGLKDPAAKASIAGYPINSQLSLDGAAPPAGAVIHLESSNPDLIQVPATVFYPADYVMVQESFPT